MFFFKKSLATNNEPNIDFEKEKWKNKYLNLIDEQENLEKAHVQNQELLCKAIVHLSIAASGLDPQLEPYLERIRDQIKQGFDYRLLKSELESFSNVLNRLSDSALTPQQTENDRALLFNFLLQQYSSKEQQQALNQLQKTYLPEEGHQSLFLAIGRIIAAGESKESRDELCDTQTQQDQNEFVHDVVSRHLIEFLEQIEVPEDLANETETLKQQLDNHEDVIPLEQLLANMTSLLIEINNKNHAKLNEFDSFLAHITQQLSELGLTITDTGIALMDASLNRSNLDQSVSEQMNELQKRSSSATQIEPLKQVISSHIAKITVEIQEHRQNESIQREKHQRQLEELSQKIKMMEAETGELQSKLITANTNAQRDILTDLPNRLAYDERLKMEIGRWQRYHTPLCLVIWDIDFFKKVNDQFGHQVGDKVLVHIASLFSNNIRRADFIARFGGEEFIMLLPHTNKHSALKVSEKLRSLIEQSHLEIQGKPLLITVSCGITQFLKGDMHESAFERADQALYRAKEQGRNLCYLG